jgi:hypothetical protein
MPEPRNDFRIIDYVTKAAGVGTASRGSDAVTMTAQH